VSDSDTNIPLGFLVLMTFSPSTVMTSALSATPPAPPTHTVTASWQVTPHAPTLTIRAGGILKRVPLFEMPGGQGTRGDTVNSVWVVTRLFEAMLAESFLPNAIKVVSSVGTVSNTLCLRL
jgi:hypothetical protein